MGQIRRFLWTAVVVCLVLWGFVPGTQAAEVIDSGTCGDDLRWVLTEDGTLTISGTGDMTETPWTEYATQIRRLCVEEGVTSLADRAFSGFAQLEEVTLADSITSLGASCFNGCSALKHIDLPPLLTELPRQVLYMCSSLESVTIGENVEYIWNNAFGWCESLREVRIPDSVRIVGYSAFYYCRGLEQLTFGSQVSSLDLYAFMGCESLTEVVLPDSLRIIGQSAFTGCENLRSIRFNEGLIELGSEAFSGCEALETVELSTSVKIIGENAFFFCDQLRQVILPEGLEQIGQSAFAYCPALEDLVIPASVIRLGNRLVDGSDAFKTLHIMGSSPEIGEKLLYGAPEGVEVCVDRDGVGYDDPAWASIALTFCSYSVTHDASCTQSGTAQLTCSHCDLDHRYPVPSGHAYSLWYTALEPTETETGLWERQCAVCGETEQWQVPAAEQTPLVSQNETDQNYWGYHANPIRSYLRDNRDGTLTRIEGGSDGVSVEVFDENYQLLSRKVLPMELPLFGGFYEGEDRFFLVFGQTNPEEDDEQEVIRVVCYTKDWVRQGYASQLGYDITIPFDAGSLRMVQSGDTLYILTSREMYQSDDGLNHQSNLLLQVPVSKISGGEAHVLPAAGYDSWYVSHSLNQFLMFDGERVLSLDHGDANPRSAVIAEIGSGAKRVHAVMQFTDSSQVHYNYTGASLGAFLQSDSAYLTAGSSILQDGTVEMNGQRNIFLGVTTRDAAGSYTTEINWITTYEDGTGLALSVPHLVKIDGDRFLLLWNEGKNENRVLRYVFVDGRGQVTGPIYGQNLAWILSDCVPVVAGSKVCWYTTLDSVPVFFEIPLDTPENPRIISPEITITLQYENAGMLEQTTVTGFYGKPLGELPVPERKSAYIFKGWRSNSYDTYESGMILDRVADFTLYARWETQEHTHEYDTVRLSEANCENPAVDQLICKYCDHNYTTTSGFPVHTWDEGHVGLEPTCTQKGEFVYTCTLCQKERTEKIAANGHNWQETTVPATCTEDGYYLRSCPDCGEEFRNGTIFAPGHRWDKGRCTRCGATDPGYVPENPFTDVKETDYFLEPVLWAVDKGITAGTSSTTFSPDNPCTRAQVVTFLWRAMGKPEPETAENPFADVAPADYFYKAVLWALEEGITSGTSATTFAPSSPCTRDQVVTFLWRAMGKPASAQGDDPFTDVAEGAYFYEPVLWAVEQGITAGTSATTFSPGNPCTRAQVVTFLWRAMK